MESVIEELGKLIKTTAKCNGKYMSENRHAINSTIQNEVDTLSSTPENTTEDEFCENIDRRVLGFLSCLSFLLHGYRWGTIPTQVEERQRTELQIPGAIWRPFTQVLIQHCTSSLLQYRYQSYSNKCNQN